MLLLIKESVALFLCYNFPGLEKSKNLTVSSICGQNNIGAQWITKLFLNKHQTHTYRAGTEFRLANISAANPVPRFSCVHGNHSCIWRYKRTHANIHDTANEKPTFSKPLCTVVECQLTFPVLHSTCIWRVTSYMGKSSAAGQPTRPTQPFLLSRSINE